MSSYELKITTAEGSEVDDKYADQLVVALARYGYSPYFSGIGKRNDVCIRVEHEDLLKLKDG